MATNFTRYAEFMPPRDKIPNNTNGYNNMPKRQYPEIEERTFSSMHNEIPNYTKHQANYQPYNNGFVDAGRGFKSPPANQLMTVGHQPNIEVEEKPSLGYVNIPYKHTMDTRSKAPRQLSQQLTHAVMS